MGAGMVVDMGQTPVARRGRIRTACGEAGMNAHESREGREAREKGAKRRQGAAPARARRADGGSGALLRLTGTAGLCYPTKV